MKKKIVKKKSHSSKRLSLLLLPFFIVLAFVTIIVPLILVNTNVDLRSLASFRKNTIKGTPISFGESVNLPIEKGVAGKTLKKNTTSNLPLQINGSWFGREVKSVPIDRFFTAEDDTFRNYGIRSITELNDTSLVVGGTGGFLRREAKDPEWLKTQLTIIPEEFNQYNNVIQEIVEVNKKNGNTYMAGNSGIVRVNEDNTIYNIKDPANPTQNLETHGLVPYDSGDMIGYSDYAIFFMNDSIIRKWNTPKPDPLNPADTIYTLFIKPGSTDEIYGIVRHCEPIGGGGSNSCVGQYDTYLYKFSFSPDPNVPLTAIKLGTINLDSSGENFQAFQTTALVKDSLDPNKYNLYLQLLKNSQSIHILKDFNENNVEHTFARLSIPGGEHKDFIVEGHPEGVELYFSSFYPTVGINLDNNFQDVFKTMVFDDKNALANHSVNTVSLLADQTLLYGHEYLPGQGNNGLISIFSTPLERIVSPAGATQGLGLPDQSHLTVDAFDGEIRLQDNMTFETWVNLQPTESSDPRTIIYRRHLTHGMRYSFTVGYKPQEGRGRLSLQLPGSSAVLTTQDLLLPNFWYHIAVVKQGSTMRLFINGRNVNTLQATLGNVQDDGNSVTYIGARKTSSTQPVNAFLKGSLDDFRVSNSVIDVKQLWQTGTYQNQLTPNANSMALWHFNNNFDNSALTSPTITPVGSPTFENGIVLE